MKQNFEAILSFCSHGVSPHTHTLSQIETGDSGLEEQNSFLGSSFVPSSDWQQETLWLALDGTQYIQGLP